VVKVIWHKASLPPHMDGSVIFARWRQCDLLAMGSRVHIPNGIAISSAVFAYLAAESPYTLQWVAHSPSKLPLAWGYLDSHLIHGSLVFHRTSQPKRHLDRFKWFLRGSRQWQNDRQTDRPRYSVCIAVGRIYEVQWCGLKYNQA